jgi:hypothetical protein
MRTEDFLSVYIACGVSERRTWRKRDARKLVWGMELWEFVHVVIVIYAPRKDVPDESRNSQPTQFRP